MRRPGLIFGRHLTVFCYCIFVLTAMDHNCYAEEQKDSVIIYKESFRLLCDANTFYLNDDSQTMAFFVLFENKDAINIFTELLRESKTGVGMVYALLGLFEHDENRYNEILKSVDLSKGVYVKTIPSADYSMRSSLGEMKIAIENGVWMRNLRTNASKIEGDG
ncbi:MAG: hypothetical protein LBQ69_03455 [Treponema sp.]|nr:hypothetical protein [Treponema sp.]